MGKNKVSTLLIAIICITPLVFIPFTLYFKQLGIIIVDFFMLPKLLFVALCAFIILIMLAYCKDSPEAPKEKLTEYLMGLYLLLVAVSTVLSIDPYLSLVGAMFYNEGLLTILLYAFLFMAAKRCYSHADRHSAMMTAFSSLIGLYGMLQFLGYDLTITEMTGKVYATFRNPNYFGAYLVLMLPVSIFAYLRTSRKIVLPAVAILYFCLLCTNTRGSWLGFLVSVLVFLYYSIRLKYQTRRLLTVFAVLAMVTAVYILIVNRQLIERFASIFIEFKNVVTLSENYESGGSKRIFIWKCALQIIREHPFFGTGPETFSKVIYSRFSLHFFKAHNEYLNIAQSSGIPALIVYAAWLADVIRNGIKGIRKNIYILPYLASVTGYAVQAFFNVSIVAVAYIFWIFSGILVSTGTDINSKYSNY